MNPKPTEHKAEMSATAAMKAVWTSDVLQREGLDNATIEIGKIAEDRYAIILRWQKRIWARRLPESVWSMATNELVRQLDGEFQNVVRWAKRKWQHTPNCYWESTNESEAD